MSGLFGLAAVGSWLLYKNIKNKNEYYEAEADRQQNQRFAETAHEMYKEKKDQLVQFTDPEKEKEIKSQMLMDENYNQDLQNEIVGLLGEYLGNLLNETVAFSDGGLRLKLAQLGKIPISDLDGVKVKNFLKGPPNDYWLAYNELNFCALKAIQKFHPEMELTYICESRLGYPPHQKVYDLDMARSQVPGTAGIYCWSIGGVYNMLAKAWYGD